MSKIGLTQAIEITAVVSVVVGLVPVAYELRQNSELMRVQINQARADAAMVSNEHSFNSDYMPAILMKVRNGLKTLSRAVIENLLNDCSWPEEDLIPRCPLSSCTAQ